MDWCKDLYLCHSQIRFKNDPILFFRKAKVSYRK